MKNRKSTDKQMRNLYCEQHSNLALLTTAVAMITFVVLMLIYMGTFQSGNNISMQRVDIAYSFAPVAGVICWILSAVLCIIIAVKRKKYLIEYAVYTLVMGFGLFFMYNMPMFIYNAFFKFNFVRRWAQTVFIGMSVFAVGYFLVSLVWHLVLATPRKSKK